MLHGRIKTVTMAGGGAGYGFKVQFEGDYYTFDCTTDADDPKSLRVTVSSPDQSHAISSLALKSSDGSRVLTTSVFTGKLDYFQYAVNEMVTLILPAGIEGGKPVVLCFQWTEDDSMAALPAGSTMAITPLTSSVHVEAQTRTCQ